MKRCCACNQVKPLDDFNHHATNSDGRQKVCRSCCKERYRRNRNAEIARRRRYYVTHKQREDQRIHQWRRAHPELVRACRERQRQVHSERVAARNAVRKARLQRRPCEICGSTTNVEAHHTDYSKPLHVRWLCRQHHKQLHRQMKGESL